VLNPIRDRILDRAFFWFSLKSPQHLRHPCPADAKKAGERRPVFKLARAEKQLVVPGELERVAGFFCRQRFLRFAARLRRKVPRSMSPGSS